MIEPTAKLNDGVQEVFATSDGENFFGYYDKSPFDATDRYLLSHRVHFPSQRTIHPDDTAEIVIWDTRTGSANVLAETHAFNWQQGSHLQWLGPDFSSRIIYNDFRENCYVSVIRDIESDNERVLMHPIYTVSPNGKWAICVNYDRLFWCRPGYRYEQGGDDRFNCPLHSEDGLTLLNLDTGDGSLIISTKQMTAYKPASSMQGATHYLEHALFSPNGKRFMFMHRWLTGDGGLMTRVFTASRDGSEIRLVSDAGDVSHYAWRSNYELLLFGSMTPGLNRIRRSKWLSAALIKPLRPLFKALVRPGHRFEKRLLKSHYHLINVTTGQIQSVGRDIIWLDGHPSFHPTNQDLFCSDSYQNTQGYRELFLYDIAHRHRTEIGSFFSPAESNDKKWRCDLHPRFNRSGDAICIDSLHAGTRQLYINTLPKKNTD